MNLHGKRFGGRSVDFNMCGLQLQHKSGCCIDCKCIGLQILERIRLGFASLSGDGMRGQKAAPAQELDPTLFSAHEGRCRGVVQEDLRWQER